MIASLSCWVFSLAGKNEVSVFVNSSVLARWTLIFSSVQVTERLWQQQASGLGGGAGRKTRELRTLSGFLYPPHCLPPLPLDASVSVSVQPILWLSLALSLPPFLMKVVLCSGFAHFNCSHSSKFKLSQMVPCDCLKPHRYTEITSISLFSSIKIMFLHMPKPSRGHPSISDAWILQQKGAARPVVASNYNCALEFR